MLSQWVVETSEALSDWISVGMRQWRFVLAHWEVTSVSLQRRVNLCLYRVVIGALIRLCAVNETFLCISVFVMLMALVEIENTRWGNVFTLDLHNTRGSFKVDRV